MRIFLHTIFNSPFMIHPSALPTLQRAVEDGFVDTDVPAASVRDAKGAVYTQKENGSVFDEFEKDSIAVIPLRGIMTKYDSWYSFGTDRVASWIHEADKSENVSGIIIEGDTPGGAVSSLFALSDVISARTKPVYMFSDYMLCSCGYYIASLCDKIFSVNNFCEVGSIGVMATVLRRNEKTDNRYGYYLEDVYPPESKDKNIELRKSEKGDDTLLINEILTPLAKNFQQVVKTNRPQIRTDAEGVLTGKTFFAQDALSLGLIDGIASFESVVNIMKGEIETRKSIINSFK